MPENIEVFFPVGVSVSCVVGADYLVLKDLLCSFIEAVCKPVRFCLTFAGVAAPACGVHPFSAVAGGVEVYADENCILDTFSSANGVYSLDTDI